MSTRVFLRNAEGVIVHEGWALNVSRGGVRAILEEKVELGQEFDVEVGTDDGTARKSRIVWMQEEPDGVIVGIEFIGLSGTHRSAPPPASDVQAAATSIDDEPEGSEGGSTNGANDAAANDARDLGHKERP